MLVFVDLGVEFMEGGGGGGVFREGRSCRFVFCKFGWVCRFLIFCEDCGFFGFEEVFSFFLWFVKVIFFSKVCWLVGI